MLLGIAVAAALWVAPATDSSDPQTVAEEVATLVESGDLEGALARITAANLRHPTPIYTFMRASLEEQLGRCDAAVALYREFLLASDVGPTDQAAATAGLRRCGAETAQPAAEPTVEPTPEPAPPPVIPAPATVRPAQRPPRVDAWGIGLTSAGVVLAAAGAGLWGQALVDIRAARGSETRADFLSLSRRSGRLEPAGITLVSMGAALAVGGIVRLVFVEVRRRRSSQRAAR